MNCQIVKIEFSREQAKMANGWRVRSCVVRTYYREKLTASVTERELTYILLVASLQHCARYFT
jgi:hypothetical protein